MILKASQRGGGAQLARHLTSLRDNDHVEVHELRGFVSSSLEGAFREAYAVSRGTRCSQFLFSLSLSPPERENVPADVFESVIARIEERMGLTDQPRAIVFHEKEGRRHAHCVWSRIDAVRMRAINLAHYKLKLRDLSREIFLEQDWSIPRGLITPAGRNRLNFTLAEWQQAKRMGEDPRFIKQIIHDCWKRSDSALALAAALNEYGLWLARGDRRGFVVMDWRGEVYALSRWAGIRVRDVRMRLGDSESLPTIDKTRTLIAERLHNKLHSLCTEEESRYARDRGAFAAKRDALVALHRRERAVLRERQKTRAIAENRERAGRLPTGIKALWFRITGRYQRICEENEREYRAALGRDRQERQALIDRQMKERRALQQDLRQIRHHHALGLKKLHRDIGRYLESTGQSARESEAERPLVRQRRKRLGPLE